jgi:hypothetical protein
MTREEWERSSDPVAMLQVLREPSERKLRLAACAVATYSRIRSVDSPVDRASLNAIQVAERYADGQASLQELQQAGGTSLVSWWTVTDRSSEQALRGLLASDYPHGKFANACHVLRDLFGNPWLDTSQWPQGECPRCKGRGREGRAETLWAFPACKACHGSGKSLLTGPWLTWKGGLVATLARTIYDRRAWEELPILADSLEEAGCQVDELLFHLRGEVGCHHCEGAGVIYDPPYSLNRLQCPVCHGEGMVDPPQHVLGCWALDLLLGKS